MGNYLTENDTQRHNHEFVGSVMLAEEGRDRHNHRFAGVSSEVIYVERGHVHRIRTTTDHLDHHHDINAMTSLPVNVGDGKHVHFVRSVTSVEDNHEHGFRVATLIEEPLV